MKKLIVLFVLLFLPNCGGNDSSPSTTAGPISSSYNFNIANFTGLTMIEAYLHLSSSTEWGQNQLSTSIPNGSVIQLPNIEAGVYNFAGVFTDNNSFYFAYRQDINIQNNYSLLTLLVTDLTGALELKNGSIYSIATVYMVPDGSASWGANLINSPIAPGTSYQFLAINAGNYDLKIILSDGTIYINTISNPNYITISHGSLRSVYL